jgi:hypothetical protein
MLEFENQIPLRWSEGIFKIVPKQKIKNLCLNFRSLNKERKIIVFLENKIKNIKHEFILEKDNEYIITLSVQDIDRISFHISPNMKINNEKEIRTLGLYVKKIYTNDIDINSIELLNSNDVNYTHYLVDKNNTNTKKYIETSLYEQNKSIKFLDLNYTRRNFEFNSSIFKFNDKKYLMTRNSQFVTQKMTLNSLKLYEYDTLKLINLNIKEEVDFEQFEDPRVLVYNDKIYVSCATYIHDAFHLVHQKMLVFDKDFNHIDNIHFKYGFNGINLKENTGIEKNWTFFEYNGKLMFVHQMNPHTVVETDLEGKIITEYKTHFNVKSKWKFGEPRLSTNPIYKDGYYHKNMPPLMLKGFY